MSASKKDDSLYEESQRKFSAQAMFRKLVLKR